MSDNTEARIAALETAVADLQAEVKAVAKDCEGAYRLHGLKPPRAPSWLSVGENVCEIDSRGHIVVKSSK
jgi:hypothetical protein